MMLDKNMLLSDKQLPGIELQRQRRTQEEQVAIVAKFLCENGIGIAEDAIAPASSPCPDPPAEAIGAPASPGADSMQASDKMLPQSIVADPLAGPPPAPPAAIGPAQSRLELTADEYRIAKNLLFARALGHPSLAALEHYATEHFPHMAAVSQEQWDMMEQYRQLKSHEQQMQTVADFLVEINPLDCSQASVDFDAEANNEIMDGPIRPAGDEPAEAKLKMVFDLGQGYTMYETNQTAYDPTAATPVSYANFRSSFNPHGGELTKIHWMLVEYPVGCKDLLARHMASISEEGIDVYYDITAEADCTSMFLFKPSYHKFSSKLRIANWGQIQEPVAVLRANLPTRHGNNAAREMQLRICKAREASITSRVSNMRVMQREEYEQYTAELLYNHTKSMTEEELVRACIDARLKETGLSPLQELLKDAAIETRLMNLRRITGSSPRNIVYAHDLKGMVQSPAVFKESWKQLHVTIHDMSLLTPLMPRVGGYDNVVTLETFLKSKELHQNISLLIMGGPRLGKTELAKLMCVQLSLMYHPVDEAYFIMAMTLDAIRDNQSLMKEGVPVLIDDVRNSASGKGQLIYSDVSIWKAILMVNNPSQTRARNNDIKWARHQPKVVTSNSATLDEWVHNLDRNGLG